MVKTKPTKKAKITKKKNVTSLPSSRPKNTDHKMVVAFRIMGLSHQEIAERVGVSRPAITQLLKRLEFSQTELKDFRENRADYLTWDQLRFRKYVTDSKLKNTAPEKLKKMEKDAFEMERMELGKHGQETGTLLFADLIKNVQNTQININASPPMRVGSSLAPTSHAGEPEGPGSTPDPLQIIDGEEIVW